MQYVGKRSTYNLNDNYLGSGTLLVKAIKKYGKQNFKRTILHYCLTEEDAFELESKIVDKTFISRKDTYNIMIGGYGMKRIALLGKHRTQDTKDKIKESILALSKDKDYIEKLRLSKLGTTHSTDTKNKMSLSHSGKLMYNISLNQSKYINLELVDIHITQGWLFGRNPKTKL
jgi:hypothetical protein